MNCKMKILGVAAIGSVLICSPAAAQETAPDIIIDDWRVSQALPTICQIIHRFDERLAMTVMVRKSDRHAVLSLQSDIWRLQDGQAMQGEVSFDGWRTSTMTNVLASPLHPSLQRSPDDMMIMFNAGSWPVPAPSGETRISVRIPTIFFAGDFVIGGSAGLSDAIENCIRS